MSNDIFKRLIEKNKKPKEKEILGTIGKGRSVAWNDIRNFIRTYYDFSAEMKFFGEKYGWTIQYRKSGKTLCSLFPKTGAFTVLITLGRKEVEKVMQQINDFSKEIRETITKTPLYHDGKWLWIRLVDTKYVEDIKRLIRIKRKPKEI